MIANRILAIDYGKKRIGLAITDLMQIIAYPLDTWENSSKKEIFLKLNKLEQNKKINTILIGLPKNMDGTLGFQAKEVQSFFENYSTNSKIIYIDERLSSIQATKILHEQNINEKNQRGKKDSYAACVMLEEYLEYRR